MTIPVSFRSPNKQGEWVEMQFLARATAQGFTVSKPWGNSMHYDFVVEGDRAFHRVQVKSARASRNAGYECRMNLVQGRTQRQRYAPGDFDFYAVHLIPENLWYIIPEASIGRKTTINLNPRYRKSRYFQYLEAWHLLRADGRCASDKPEPTLCAT